MTRTWAYWLLGAALAAVSCTKGGDDIVIAAGTSSGTGTGASPGTGAGGSAATSSGTGAGGEAFAEWLETFGPEPQEMAMTTVGVDDGGNIVIGGVFSKPVDFGGGQLMTTTTMLSGGRTAFLLKLDAAGQHVWSKALGYADIASRQVAVGPAGDVTVAGTLLPGTIDLGGGPLVNPTPPVPAGKEMLFAARFDAEGHHLWSEAFGDGEQHILALEASMSLDGAGDVTVFGRYYGGANLGDPPLEGNGVFIARLDGATGAHVWSKGLPTYNTTLRAATDAPGNVVLCGFLAGGKIDLGGGPLTPSNGETLFLGKLDSNGDHVWSKLLGIPNATSASRLSGLVVSAAGDILLTGTSQDSSSFAAKLSPNGDLAWTMVFEESVWLRASTLDAAGNAIVLGAASGTVDFGDGPLAHMSKDGSDLVIVKLDPAGHLVWSKRTGAPEGMLGEGVATGPSLAPVVIGRFTIYPPDPSASPIASLGTSFVATLAP